MKLCRTCQRCYDDADTVCEVSEHGPLVHTRPGPRLIADKYRLDRLLGRGGMGAVYAGTHIDLDRLVAVKLLLPDLVTDTQALERFRREARTAAKINHPNVADIYDYGVLPDGEAYLVMELVEGQTLREYLQAAGPLSVAEATTIAAEIAAGIDAAHHFGIVHRDLKPSNIILARSHKGRLQPKVVDFGIAKLKEMSTTSGASDLTAAGALIGTPRYMSPEQCAGNEADVHSDLYTLGIILYEMLAGRTPFDAPSATALALKHVREIAPDVRAIRPDLPPALAELLRQTLAKNPNDRPQTAAEFAARLSPYIETTQEAEAGTEGHTSARVATSVGAAGAEPAAIPTGASVGADTHGDTPAISTDASVIGRSTDRAGVPTREDVGRSAEELRSTVDELSAPAGAAETVTAAKPPSAVMPKSARSDAPASAATTSLPGAPDERTRTAMSSRRVSRKVSAPLLYAGIGVMLLLGLVGALALRNRSASDSHNLPTSVASAPTPDASPTSSVRSNQATPLPPSTTQASELDRNALRAALGAWLAATNARNLEQVMSYYMPSVEIYYLDHNASRTAVRADKAQMLAQPGTVDVRLDGEPQISFGADGQTATMTFRKPFILGANEQQRSGEVLQELRWRKTSQGWRITGERDLQVLR